MRQTSVNIRQSPAASGTRSTEGCSGLERSRSNGTGTWDLWLPGMQQLREKHQQ